MLLAVVFLSATGTLAFSDALYGFGDTVVWALAGWSEATRERAASQRLAREKRVIWITPQILRLREMMVGSGSKRRKRLVFKRG